MVRLLCLVVLLVIPSVSMAQVRTDELPAALMGLDAAVMTAEEAHAVRGQSSFVVPGIDFGQWKEFVFSGVVTGGSVNMLEGLTASFDLSQTGPGTALTVEGNFAGLAGQVGANAGDGLNWTIGGKLFSETLNFGVGEINQSFRQNFQWVSLPPALP